MTAPPPGTIGLTSTPDLSGAIIRLGTRSPINHVFIVLAGGQLFEARPSGAGLNNLSRYPHASFRTDIIPTDEQRGAIIASVTGLMGTPYNWLDIAALSWWCLTGNRVPVKVQRRIEDTKTLICSQLVDLVYERAGIHLFDDGRLPGAVTPGDLIDCVPVLAA